MTTDIQAVLFDKDGTLLDFNRTWLAPYEAAANFISDKSKGQLSPESILAAGGYIAVDQTWKPDSLLASGSNGQILESWNGMLDSPLNAQDVTQIGEMFTLAASQYIPACEPLRPCLEQLKSRGMSLGIATMDDQDHAENMSIGLGINDLFDFICGADSGFGVKPEPGMVEAFAAATGLSTSQIAMVGDSPKDIKMGLNAGAGLSIGVLTGAHDAAELHKYTPHVLATIEQLPEFLKG